MSCYLIPASTRRATSVLAALLAVLLAMLSAGAAQAAASRPAPDHGEWPLVPTPAVVATFSPPERPWLGGHRGVDLGGVVGQPVRAALAGTVSFVGRIDGVGMVSVDHGSTRTTYQPVTAGVSRGQRVAAGDPIGSLAWFGSHCFPRACLHWGWLDGDDYLDPLDLVGGGPRPVRLLPTDPSHPAEWSHAASYSRRAVGSGAGSAPRRPCQNWWLAGVAVQRQARGCAWR